jgi:hypothetical protein
VADLRDGAIKLSAGRKQHRLVRPALLMSDTVNQCG